MKPIRLLLFCACALLSYGDPALDLPEARMTVAVREVGGGPITDAKVRIIFMKTAGPMARDLIEAPAAGVTDAAGQFSASGSCYRDLMAVVEKEGYYQGSTKTVSFSSVVERKWQPWNPTVPVILRKIGKPIAMYAKKVQTELPVAGKPVGFDFQLGDWVAPYGRGKSSDVSFFLRRRFGDVHHYDSTLFLNFRSPADGMQSWKDESECYSTLKMPPMAPEEGYLQPLSFSNISTPERGIVAECDESRNWYMRVRSTLNPAGKLVRANYGKIAGDITFSPIGSTTCSLEFTYYLNPTENDRNVEFDVRRNLVRDLTDEEQVRAP